MVGFRVFRTAAVATGAVVGLTGAALGLLSEQSKRAEVVIGEPEGPPLNADGVYLPDGSGPHPFGIGPDPLRFAVIGDSSAAGLGVDLASQLPGVLLARSLAEEAGRSVLLTTYAISGATTRDLAEQVDRALADPPTVALVIIGANDVSGHLSVRGSAKLLEAQLVRLRSAGAAVVMATCPDLGTIRPIPQPLRSVARAWSLLLASTSSPPCCGPVARRSRWRNCCRRSSSPGRTTCSARTASTPTPPVTRRRPRCCWRRCAWRPGYGRRPRRSPP